MPNGQNIQMITMETPLSIPSGRLIGCPDCDLLITYQPSQDACDARCPRCNAILFKSCHKNVSKTLAFSLSALFLFVPACFLPLMGMNIFGYPGSCTMIKGVTQMMKDGFFSMALLVMFCSIIVPLSIQLLLFYMSFHYTVKRYPTALRTALILYQHLSEWSMLDVYMLGILIALIKMEDYGYIFSGPGLYCFVGVLIMTNLAMLSFDPHMAWEALEEKAA